MDPLAKALQAQALDDVRMTARAARRNAIVYVLVGVLALFAIGALLTAGGIWLAAAYGPAVAALLIAAALIVLALVLVALNMWLNRRERRMQRLRHAASAVKYSAILTALPYLAKASSPWSLLAIGVISYAITRWGPRHSGDD